MIGLLTSYLDFSSVDDSGDLHTEKRYPCGLSFALHLAGYVSDPMSTMRFHSCSSSFEESSSEQHTMPGIGQKESDWAALNRTPSPAGGEHPYDELCASTCCC